MATSVRLLAFAGSARRDSWNRKFLAAGIEAVRAAGAEVTVADLNELVLPLYHGDLEDSAGIPANAVQLIGLITDHDGLLIASPEYNSMITPLLKNTIDWCSRADDNPFEGKVAAVIAASPGPLGGIRSLQMAQALLLKLGCHIVPGQCHLPLAEQAFDPAGRLTDDRARKALHALAGALVKTVSKLKG